MSTMTPNVPKNALQFLWIAVAGSALASCSVGSSSGSSAEGFPTDEGTFNDYDISFPVQVKDVNTNIDLTSTYTESLTTLSSDMCAGVPECVTVKRLESGIDQAGNFVTGLFDGVSSNALIFIRKNGSVVKTVASDGEVCEYDSYPSRSPIGYVSQTQSNACGDTGSTGRIGLFAYSSETAEVVSESYISTNEGAANIRQTYLVDRSGGVKGLSVSISTANLRINGASYSVKNPNIPTNLNDLDGAARASPASPNAVEWICTGITAGRFTLGISDDVYAFDPTNPDGGTKTGRLILGSPEVYDDGTTVTPLDLVGSGAPKGRWAYLQSPGRRRALISYAVESSGDGIECTPPGEAPIYIVN